MRIPTNANADSEWKANGNRVEGEQLSVQRRVAETSKSRRGWNPASEEKPDSLQTLDRDWGFKFLVGQIDPEKPRQSDDHSEI